VAISLDDKELSFETELRSSSIKVKFTLKDMLYHGSWNCNRRPGSGHNGGCSMEPHPPAAL